MRLSSRMVSAPKKSPVRSVAEGPIARRLDGALDGVARRLQRKRLGLGAAAPARFGGQDDLALAVGDENRLGPARQRSTIRGRSTSTRITPKQAGCRIPPGAKR
jgi:hypothetical protein